MTINQETKLLSMEQVVSRVGISRAAIYKRIKSGRFPKQIKEGAKSLWVSDEITAWIAHRANSRGVEAK